jgi:hypothetical protein
MYDTKARDLKFVDDADSFVIAGKAYNTNNLQHVDFMFCNIE